MPLVALHIHRERFVNDTKAIGATVVLLTDVAEAVGPVTVTWRDGAPELALDEKAYAWLDGQGEYTAGDVLQAVLDAARPRTRE